MFSSLESTRDSGSKPQDRQQVIGITILIFILVTSSWMTQLLGQPPWQMSSLLPLFTALAALLVASRVLALPDNASAAAAADSARHTEDTKSYCGWYGNKGPWEIYTAGWGRDDGTSQAGCGSGLLASLRYECYPWIISEWACAHPRSSANDSEHGAVSSFKLKYVYFNGIWTDCVEEAFFQASGKKERVRCRDMAHDE